MRSSIALLILAVSCAASAAQPDTAHLSAHLRVLRGKKWLTPAEYSKVQAEYLDWLDARVRSEHTIDSINRELKAAGLLPDWKDDVDAYFKSHAGYLDEVSTKTLRGSPDLLVVTAGIYRGAGCSLDITAVLYQRKPLQRLSYLNAEDSKTAYPHYLSGLDAGQPDSKGERLVASGWTTSNCTSVWNGKRIRIDRLNGDSMQNVLGRGLAARSRDSEEDVAAWVQNDVVTFRYEGATGDADLMAGPSVARYRIAGGDALRETPVALTRAGFLHEWLDMDDADAARWSAPEARKMHQAVAAAFLGRAFEWAHVARCDGSPPVWEVAVRLDEPKTLHVFRISGTRATDLRMLAVSDNRDRACAEVNIKNSLTSVGAELPW